MTGLRRVQGNSSVVEIHASLRTEATRLMVEMVRKSAMNNSHLGRVAGFFFFSFFSFIHVTG